MSAVYPKLSYIDPTSYLEKTSREVVDSPKETPYNATAKITTPSGLNVRKSASESAARIGGVYKNDVVTIVAKAGNFYKIKFGAGYGYITNNSSYLIIQIPEANEISYSATAKITTPSGLNVRKSASESAARIGGVYKNDVVTIVAKAGNFYKIKFGAGYGYITNNSSYLTIQTPTSTNKLVLSVNTTLYDSPSFTSKTYGQLAPQTVTVLEAGENGWYKISAYLGPKWVCIQTAKYTSYLDLDLRLNSAVTANTINNWIKKSKPSSLLLGTGQLYINAQNKYGVNAVYLVAHAMVESSWGTSYLTKTKRNIYGQNAVDWNPNAAFTFKSFEQAIMYQAYIVRKEWLESNGNRYNGPTLVGMNKTYASDKNWAKSISVVMNEFEKFNANNYMNKQPIPVNLTNPYK